MKLTVLTSLIALRAPTEHGAGFFLMRAANQERLTTPAVSVPAEALCLPGLLASALSAGRGGKKSAPGSVPKAEPGAEIRRARVTSS
jgi:hypothetical protein